MGRWGGATAAHLSPGSIAIDNSNNIYFSDSSNRIRKITASTGIITTIAGNGSATYSGDGGMATAAGIFNAEGIAVDDNGNVYIVDENRDKIRKINASGIINRIAGAGTGIFSGDGGDPLLANFTFPTGVAVDRKGRIYIADEANQRVRCIGCNVPTEIANIATIRIQKIVIFPNPTSSRFDVTLPSVLNEQVEYKIFDAMGKMLKQFVGQTNSQQSLELNAPSGLYYIQAVTSSRVFTEKLVVE